MDTGWRITPQLGVTDVRFDSLHQLGRHVPNAMFLCMLRRLCEDLLFGLAPHHVLTPAGWIDLGAFQDLGHELISLLIGVEMIDDDTRAVARTLCLVCMGGNTFFSGATATMRHPNGCVEVTGGERIMSSRMIALSEVIEQERRRGMPVRRVWPNEDSEAIDRLGARAK
jgi:hypothetical protein